MIYVIEMITKDSMVSCMGSSTLHEIGLQVAFKNGGYNFFDPDDTQGAIEKDKVAHQALSADYNLMSFNVISATGGLVNIDGYNNPGNMRNYYDIVAGLIGISPHTFHIEYAVRIERR